MNTKYDKIKMLDLMRVEYDFWERSIAVLTPVQMTTPNVQGPWSIKDTMAHMTAWMQRLLDWFESAERGETPIMPEAGATWAETDAINLRQYEADKELELGVVLENFRNTFQKVYRMVERLDADQLYTNWKGLFRDPAYEYIIDNMHLHFEEHIVPVREWIAAGAQPN
jgi:hypothetical protein